MLSKATLIISVLCFLTLNHILSTEAANKYNISLLQLNTCKEYDIRGTGYNYKDFFLVHTLNSIKINDTERLHLKFYVMTDMDAHVLLAVNDHPRLYDRIYEIVIGAGSDTFSTIRLNMGRRRAVTNQQDPQLLSIFEPTPIEIIQSKSGKLDVFITGYKAEPLLSYEDADPLDINYISFSSFGYSNARWFYDCSFDGFDGEIEEEQRPLSTEQQLMANITLNTTGASMPSDMKLVEFAFEIHSVFYDQESSILKTRLYLLMYWNDTRIQWDPKNFSGHAFVSQQTLSIWKPKLTVLNGAFESFYNFDPSHELTVHSNGSVMLLSKNIEISTWCANTAKNWPNEQFICDINIGLDVETLIENDSIELEYDNTRPIADEPVSTLSEWRFAAIIVDSILNDITKRINKNGIRQSKNGDIIIGIVIGRNSGFYKGVFTMPVLACQTLIILSFLLRGYRRGALILVVFVIDAMGLIFISRHAPANYVPDLMIMYQHLMRITTFCYLLHILIMWLDKYPPKQTPSDWLVFLINYSPLRLLLCMRFSDSTDYVNIQEHPWHELGKIFNNLSFLIVNIIFIIGDVLLLPK